MIIFRANSDNDLGSILIDFVHDRNLLIAFGDIILVDAHSVGPNKL